MRLLALCLFAFLSTASAAETLHLYTWADYISPDVVKKFEKQHNCSVVIDTFDSNESLYARLKAGATGYDLLFPTSYMAQILDQEGLLEDLDHAAIANLKQVDPDILSKVYDSAMKRSVPYTLGYAVIAVRKDKVKDAVPTWEMLTREAYRGRVTLLDDMRETLGAALKFLGYSINSVDVGELEKARDVVIGWKRNAAKFDNEGYKAGLDSGEFVMVHGYSGDLFQVAQENAKIEILIPKEGVTASCDEMVIPKSAQQKALAQAMIQFLLDPEIAAENMEWMGYLCPNKEAIKQVSPEFLENPAVTISEEVKAKSEVIRDVGKDLAKYTKVWDEVKAAK